MKKFRFLEAVRESSNEELKEMIDCECSRCKITNNSLNIISEIPGIESNNILKNYFDLVQFICAKKIPVSEVVALAGLLLIDFCLPQKFNEFIKILKEGTTGEIRNKLRIITKEAASKTNAILIPKDTNFIENESTLKN